jgi:uncharacterized membrane protein YcaP (DUF421 family)
MIDALIGHAGDSMVIAAKAALLFALAIVAYRLSGRRTLAEMNSFDLIAAVAAGSVVGRIPNSTSTSVLEGVATLFGVLGLHAVVTRVRLRRTLPVVEPPPLLLVTHGQVRDQALDRAQVTRNDLASAVRAAGLCDIEQVQWAVFEPNGSISVIASPDSTGADQQHRLISQIEVDDPASPDEPRRS